MGLAVGVGQGGHVEEVVGLEGVVVGREGAAVNTGLDALGVVAGVFHELVGGGDLVLVVGLHDGQRGTTVLGVGLGAVCGRHLGDAPLAVTVRSAGKQVVRHPSAGQQGCDGAVIQTLVPIVGPADGLGVDEIFVDHLLPEVGEGLDVLVTGQVDGHGPAVLGDLERGRTGQPGHGVEEAGVTGIGGDVGVHGANLLGGLVEVVPRAHLSRIDAGLVEDALVVEPGHRAGIHRQGVDAVIDVHRGPRARGVEVLEIGGTEIGKVLEVAANHVFGQCVVFDLGDVRSTGACLDGVGQCVVLVLVGAGVGHLHLNVRVLGLESLDRTRQCGIPGPHGQLDLLIRGAGASAIPGRGGTAGSYRGEHGHSTDQGNCLLAELHRSFLPCYGKRRDLAFCSKYCIVLRNSTTCFMFTQTRHVAPW